MKKMTWGIIVGIVLSATLHYAQAQPIPPAGYEEKVLTVETQNPPSPKKPIPPAGYEEEIRVAPASRPTPPAGFEEEINVAPAPVKPKPVVRPPSRPTPPAGFEEEIKSTPPAGFEEEIPTPPTENENIGAQNFVPSPIEQSAIRQAEEIIERTTPIETVPSPIQAPAQPNETKVQLKECYDRFPGTDFASPADSDGDGLSNATECYAGTDPMKADSDGDSCSDGTELNEVWGNPIDPNDCGRQEAPEEKIATITDPHPGWVVRQAKISGIVPQDAESVTVVVFPVEPETTASTIRPSIQPYIGSPIRAFLKKITNINTVLATEPSEPSDPLFDPPSDPQPIVLGTASEFSATEIRGARAQRFSVKREGLKNGIYDMTAIATLKNGTAIASEPIRFSVDEELAVQKPEPESIANQPVKPIEIEIDQSRPTVSGNTEFGTRVFAIWESLVLTSSIIADSEAGSFTIQAPRELEPDIAHKVTLYAVKNDANGKKTRSENVNVFFRIRPQKNSTVNMNEILMALAALAFLGGGTWWFRRALHPAHH